MRGLVKRDFTAIAAIVIFFTAFMLSAELAHCAIASGIGQSEPNLAPPDDPGYFKDQKALKDNGLVYSESSVVKGIGDVSIRGKFSDRAADSKSWLKGNGSINFESKRNMSKKRAAVDFNQVSDLVFAGGLLISIKSLQSPLFYNRSGASIDEWSNLNHVNKSEIDIIRSTNRLNNTLAFKTELAFDGIWDIKNRVGSGFGMKKSAERYSGSFATQKDIEFSESGRV